MLGLNKKSQRARRFPSFSIICCFVLGFFSVLSLSAARPSDRGRGAPVIKQISEGKGEEVLENFRNIRLNGDFVFLFDLENIPRRGKKTHYEGLIWGTWNQYGPLNRVILWKPEAPSEPVLQIIAQGGADPQVWTWDPENGTQEMGADKLFEPLLAGNRYSAFDLLMPFVYWDAIDYRGSKRVKGRSAHIFAMEPPPIYRQIKPNLGVVEIALDAGHHALLKADVLTPLGDRIQSVEVQSIREVDGQYIVKTIDLLDTESRSKSRFNVKAAEIGELYPLDTFNPGHMESIPDTSHIDFKQI